MNVINTMELGTWLSPVEMLARTLNLIVYRLVYSRRSDLEKNSPKVFVLCIFVCICIFNIWFHVAFQSEFEPVCQLVIVVPT